MMTRKDFAAIAEIIREEHLRIPSDSPSQATIAMFMEKSAKYFKQSNPTFDRSKFIRACGFYQE